MGVSCLSAAAARAVWRNRGSFAFPKVMLEMRSSIFVSYILLTVSDVKVSASVQRFQTL